MFEPTTVAASPPVAAIADLDNGSERLVVGQTGSYGTPARDRIELFDISPDHPAELIGQLNAFDNSGFSSAGNLAVGNVDGTSSGDEIVVADDGSRRRASHIRVFGGLADGAPRLICRFRGLRSIAAVQQPLVFALGNVFDNADHPEKQIVVSDAHGFVYVWSVEGGHATLLRWFVASTGVQHTPPQLAVGNVLPDSPGDEIVTADVGSDQQGVVHIFNGRTGTPLFEFTAFDPGQAPGSVELWIADVIDSLPGAELIVGQGRAGGLLRVFSLNQNTPRHIMDVPDPRHRTTSLAQYLAVGTLLPEFPGNELVVAQPDATFPLEMFRLDEQGATMTEDFGISASEGNSASVPVIGSIAVGGN